MQNPWHSRFLSTLALSSLVTVCASQAHASGFASARFGGELGNPISANPTAIYYNPANLAETSGYHLYIDSTFAYRKATYTHSAASSDTTEPAGAQGANNGKATLSNLLVNPMFGASAKFGDFAVGGGVYVPFGGTSVWDKNKAFEGNSQYPGAVDGVARWYSIEGTIQSIFYTLAAAYKIPSARLSFGLSTNLIHSTIHTLRARLSDGSNNIAEEGRSYTDVKSWDYSIGLGTTFEAVPQKLWIGASYQSRPNLGKGMTLSGNLRNNFGGSQSLDKVRIEQELPDIVRLGVRFKPVPEFEARVFGDYTRWSVLDRMCMYHEGAACTLNPDGSRAGGADPVQNLPRNWKDSFAIRLGASYWIDPAVELLAGTGYESNAIPSANLDPALMDFNRFSFALGGRFRIMKQFYAGLGFSQVVYLSRDTTGQSANAKWGIPSNGPDAGGKYTQSFSLLNTNVEFVF